MSIIYTLVAKDINCVLCEYTELVGNFQQVTRTILKFVEKDSKKTMEYDKYKYHYISEGNLTFLCMTENFPEKLAFACLNEIKAKFINKYEYDKISSFCTYQLSEFVPVISNSVKYYSSCPLKTEVGEYIPELSQLNIHTCNVNDFFSSNQKISIVAVKPGRLNSNSKNIANIALHIQNETKKKKLKRYFIVSLSAIIFLLVLLMLFF